MAKKPRINYISWIYRKIRKRMPLILACAILSSAISYAGIQFSLTTKSVINSAVSGNRDRAPLELEIMHGTCDQEMREFEVTAGSGLAGKTLAEIAFPSGVLVTMIRRNERFIPAKGNSCIENGDGLLIMAENRLLLDLEAKYFKNGHI